MNLCACGCGEQVNRRHAKAIYATDACKVRACKDRHAAADDAVRETVSRLPSGLGPCARRVLRALIAAGDAGATTGTLCQPQVGGVRFGARIMELRDAGLTITCVRERQGSSRYRLLACEYMERAA